jgi:hypothetical protein
VASVSQMAEAISAHNIPNANTCIAQYMT